MIPFVVMITTLFYQREFSGFFMEIYSTYPVSFSWMVIRRISQTLIVTLMAHFVWVQVYIWRFKHLQVLIFSKNGLAPVLREVKWGHLFLEALPEYLFMISITLFVMIVSKQLFAGLMAGFSYWILESISRGSITKAFTLYVSYLPDDVSYSSNRTYLFSVAFVVMIVTILVLNRRERWVVSEEID